MRVKARAVILIDGRLIVADQPRRGRRELSLPGGRVNPRESLIDTVRREVAEETGLDVTPGRLLYISEIGSASDQALELIFLAEPSGVPTLKAFQAVDLACGDWPAVRPPILEQIRRDAASGWRDTPRWLGRLPQYAPAARPS